LLTIAEHASRTLNKPEYESGTHDRLRKAAQ
jgi:hypothetical protein